MKCPICDAANPQDATSCCRCGFAFTVAVHAWSPLTPGESQRPLGESPSPGESAFFSTPPLSAGAHLDLAYSYEDRGDYEPALVEVDRALQAESGLAEAHNLRGLLLEELDRNDEALAAYRMAVQLDPNFGEAVENLNSLAEELRQQAAAPPREEAQGRGKETGWKAQLTTLEGVPSVSRGWKIVLAPVFFYLMVGTGALFLVSELEKLVYRLGHAVRAPGLSDGSATEWHTKDLRLVIAFPIVVPLLVVWNVLLLLWDGVSAVGRGISAVATRIWLGVKTVATWLADRLSRAWTWFSRGAQQIAAGIAGAVAALWYLVTGPIVAVWRVLVQAASTIWHWIAAGVALLWESLVSAFAAAWTWIAGAVSKLWGWILRPFKALWHLLGRASSAVWIWLAAAITAVCRFIAKPLKAMGRWVVQAAGMLLNSLVALLSVVGR